MMNRLWPEFQVDLDACFANAYANRYLHMPGIQMCRQVLGSFFTQPGPFNHLNHMSASFASSLSKSYLYSKNEMKVPFFTLCCIMGTALFHCNRYIAQFVGLGLCGQLLNDQQRWVFRQRADDLFWCAVPLWPGDWQCDYKWLQYFPRQLQPQGRSCSRWIPSSLPSWTGSHFVMVSVKLGLEDKTRMCRIICVHFYKAKNSNELKHLPCLGMGGLQQVNIVT